MLKTALTAVFLVLLTACSGGSSESHPRDAAFFDVLVNPADKFERREQMNELTVVTSAEKYDMRIALFDNGKFYYQVGNLGSGVGEWSFKAGRINLHAVRSFFDLDLDVGAASATGDGISVHFFDRYGRNVVGAAIRKPTAKPIAPLAPPQNPLL